MENVIEKPFLAEDIISLTGIHKLKIKNIFMYGSRVYGTNLSDSDYDIIIVASTMDRHSEKYHKIGDKLLNVHVFTPDVFKEELERHNMMNLECFFLPEHFILLNNKPLEFTINNKKLVKNALAQSFNSWRGAKLSLIDGDIYRGVKGAYHSLKILLFATQIIEHGKIIDYSATNYLYKEMQDSNEFEWDYFKEEYLPLKRKLEDSLKALVGE